MALPDKAVSVCHMGGGCDWGAGVHATIWDRAWGIDEAGRVEGMVLGGEGGVREHWERRFDRWGRDDGMVIDSSADKEPNRAGGSTVLSMSGYGVPVDTKNNRNNSKMATIGGLAGGWGWVVRLMRVISTHKRTLTTCPPLWILYLLSSSCNP